MSERTTSDDSQDARVRRVEYAVFGLRGDNGLVSEVRGLRQEFQEYRKEEAARREAEEAERKKDRRWWVGTAFAVITAILGAAAIVAGSL